MKKGMVIFTLFAITLLVFGCGRTADNVQNADSFETFTDDVEGLDESELEFEDLNDLEEDLNLDDL